MNAWMQSHFGKNWKTSMAAFVAFLMSVPQLVTAVQHWVNHQPADWRGAIAALVVAAGLAFSKDSDNHSTEAEVKKATATATDASTK
jgi:hypothetical protein